MGLLAPARWPPLAGGPAGLMAPPPVVPCSPGVPCPWGGRAITQGRDQGVGHRVGATADVNQAQGVVGVAAQLLQGGSHGFRPPFEHQAIGPGARPQVRQAGDPLAVIGLPNRPAALPCSKRDPNDAGPLGAVH